MIRSCTPAIVGMALFGSVSIVPAEPLPTETFKVLPAALAVEAAQAAMAACKAQGYAISVAVVDRTGDLKLHLIGDGAGALTPSLSRRKAYTAAMRRVSSGELAKQVAAPGGGSILRSTIDSLSLSAAACRSKSETRSSAASVSVARRPAKRTKPAPMLASLRSVIG